MKVIEGYYYTIECQIRRGEIEAVDESSYVRRRACLVGNRRWYFSNRDGKESNTEKENEKEPPTDVTIEEAFAGIRLLKRRTNEE